MSEPLKSPTLLSELTARLRTLGETAETPHARAEVDAALQSKWWSLRTVAIGVIGGWGGKANKAWLIERALEADIEYGPRRSTARMEWHWRNAAAEAAAKAVLPHLGPEDADWLLDRWFSDRPLAPTLNGYVQSRMHSGPIEKRVAEEFSRKPKDRPREQLLWLVFLRRGLPGRTELLKRLAIGRDEVAEEAKRFLKWDEEKAAREAEAIKPKKGAAKAARVEAEKAAEAAARSLAGKKGRR